MSKKQDQIKRELRKVYQEIDNEREPVCESCGQGNKPLSHSHTIGQYRCKQIGKPELITDKDNILLECFGTNKDCHNIWEWEGIKERMKLKSFDRKLKYIEKHDPEGLRSIYIQMESVSSGLGLKFIENQSMRP